LPIHFFFFEKKDFLKTFTAAITVYQKILALLMTKREVRRKMQKENNFHRD